VREDWLAAIAAHVERIERDWDAATVLDAAMLTVARQLAATLGDDPADLPVWHLLGRFHMYRDSAIYHAGEGGWEADNEAMACAFARCLLGGMAVPREVFGPVAKQAVVMAAVPDPARLWQRLASAQPPGSPMRAVLLAYLSEELGGRFTRTGDAANLEAALAVGKEAVAEAADDDPDLPAMHFLVGTMLMARFERSSGRGDLEGALASLRRALDTLSENHPNWARYLSVYGTCLRMRFEFSRDPADLEAALSACRRAVAAADDTMRPSRLPSLANVLVRRFDEYGDQADLDEAISAFRQGTDTLPEGSPELVSCLSGLGGALRVRFGFTRQPGDLDEAITAARQSVAEASAGHPDRGSFLANLASMLMLRAVVLRASEDTEEAITVGRQAVESAPAGHRLRGMFLASLSAALRTRHEREAGDDLDEAIALAREAVAITPSGDVNRSRYLLNLCDALQDRFDETADPGDADEAVETGRQMLSAVPEGHSNRGNALLTFSAALRDRSGLPGHAADLDEAVTIMRQAVAGLPPGPARTEASSSLGMSLRLRFGRSGDPDDLDGAIAIFLAAARESAEGTADGGSALFQLGNTLLIRYERENDLDDLADAVASLRQALGAPVTDPDDPALYRSELSEALRLRFERTGESTDLAEAITLARQAVEMTPMGHPGLPGYRLILGKVLHVQAQAGSVTPLDPEQATRSGLVAMLAALGDIDTADDLPAVLAPGAFDAATQLAEILAEDESPDLDSHAVLGRFFWLRYLALPESDDESGDDNPEYAALTSAINAYLPVFRAGRSVPAKLKSYIAEDVADEAVTDLFERILPVSDPRLLTEAVTLWRRILNAVPGDHPDREVYTGLLGVAVYCRYTATGHRADLDEGVAALLEATAGVRGDHDLLPTLRVFLSEALSVTAGVDGSADILDHAIEAGQQAVSETTGEDHEHARGQLGWTYVSRYHLTGDPADLTEGTALLAEAIGALPADQPMMWAHLTHLSEARQLQFAATGDVALITEAIDAGQRAVDRCPDGLPFQIACWSTLGTALLGRAYYLSDEGDLDAAIVLFARGIEGSAVGHPVRAICEVNLGDALVARYMWTGRHADLDAAIESLRHGLTVLSADSVLGARAASVLSRALKSRFQHAGSLVDLDAAIAISRQAATSASAPPGDRARYLSDYALALELMYGWTEDPGYLDAAIEAARQALHTVPAGHAETAVYRMVLATALRARCAVAANEPDPNSDAETDGTDLGAARTGYPNPDDVGTDANAQIASDLTEAVALLRQAVAEISPSHVLGPVLLSELGATLLVRFALVQDAAADLYAAVAVLRQSVAATEGQPTHAESLYRLALTLQTANEETARPEYRDEAVALYCAATRFPLASAAIRITAARDGAAFAADSDPATAADLLEEAIRLLPEAASRRLSRADQQHALGQFAFLASFAAEQVLIADGPEAAPRALGLLELGRAVLQGQALDIRRDLLDLQAAHPELAVRFSQLREQLEVTEDQEDPRVQTDTLVTTTRALRLMEANGASGAAQAGDRFRAGAEFNALLDQIRSLEDFESFLLPPQPAELTKHASHGPIVTFNVGQSRSDALVVTTEAITAVPLPDLAATDLFERATVWEESLDSIIHSSLNMRARLDAENELSQVLEWLWDVAAEPVLRHLGHLQPPGPGQAWPRVWWAAGGLLGLLPIHAAGYHRQSDACATVLDRVVSSYTPTVRALAYSRERARTAPPARALIVAMPTTPGLGPLPNVPDEAAALSDLLPSPTVLIEAPDGTVTGQTPTRHAVTSRLPDFGVVHFTCHAASDPGDPSRSQIFLHDWAENPFTVTTLIPARLHHAQLAYLSACETAYSESVDLLDEGIHLTSAFQLAGFPHVIGTLWPIYDHIAVDVATAFYTRLQSGTGTLDVSASAQALHDAIREVRAGTTGPWYPSVWAAYVHAGS